MEIKNMKVNVSGEGKLPHYSTEGSAGADLFSNEEVTLLPGERKLIPTGIKLEIPEGYVGLIWPRSGIAVRNGIDTMAGVIDSDYRGEVKVLLINHGDEPFKIEKGFKIAQLLIQKVERVEFVKADSLSDTERGEGGFGSTGI